jgi:hypothetical protein
LTITGTTTVGQNLTISAGTLVAPTSLTIKGDFINNATFTHNSGTVTFAPNNGTLTSKISGNSNTTFNNLTVTTAGSTIKFESGNAYIISGLLTATGSNGSPVSFLSTNLGEQWGITLNTFSLTYLSVQDSFCTSSTILTDGNATVVRLTGNTGTCWAVPIVSGGGGGSSDGGAGSGGSGGGGGGQGGSGNVQATAQVSEFGGGGSIATVDVLIGGSGYILVPLVCFNDPQSGSETGAIATANISGGAIIGIIVSAGGTGYTNSTVVIIGSPGSSGGSCASGGGGGGSGGGGGGSP